MNAPCQKLNLGISADRQHLFIGLQNDSALANIMRSMPGMSYYNNKGLQKGWLIPLNETIRLLNSMNQYNLTRKYDVTALKKLSARMLESQQVNHLACESSGVGMVRLSFEFNKKIVGCLSLLETAKYNKEGKFWELSVIEIPKLANLLENAIPGIDLTELHKFNPELMKLPRIVKMDFRKLKRTPFKHQVIAMQCLLAKKRMILADEQGLGKTTSSILAAACVKGRKLVVCPASLKENWKAEIEMISDEPVHVIYSDKGWKSGKGWTIINYDIASNFMTKISAGKFSVMICDEAHYIKSLSDTGKAESMRADSILRISYEIPYVFCLTGTPIPNHTKDLFNLLRLIRHPLGLSFKNFGDKYCGPTFNGYGWNYNGTSNADELNELLKDCMLRRIKENPNVIPEGIKFNLGNMNIVDLPELPPKYNMFWPVQIDLAEYDEKIDEYLKERNAYKSKMNHLVKLNIAKQMLAIEKVQETIQLADSVLSDGSPVVIFTNYNAVIDQLKEYYGNNCIVMNGKTSAKKRKKLVDSFQNGEVDVFIGNLQACSTGITLTRSSDLIFNDYSFLPSEHLQGSDRIHRISQVRECRIFYVYAANADMDELLTKMLDKKLKSISRIVNGDEVDFADEIIRNLWKTPDQLSMSI